MKREMKFRVWDNEYKGWVSYSEYQSLPDDFVLYKDCNPLFELRGRDGNEQRFVVEQYTGLKDKNGREIYEGDIANTIYTDQADKKIGDIVYITEVGAYRVRCGQQLLPIVTYRMVGGSPQGLITVANEVIGSIHENPELLK
jgi:uncharacterized phage protein (TIGR01671 family)